MDVQERERERERDVVQDIFETAHAALEHPTLDCLFREMLVVRELAMTLLREGNDVGKQQGSVQEEN